MAGGPLEASLEGQVQHWVRTRARGDGMPLDWGRWSRAVVEDLVVE